MKRDSLRYALFTSKFAVLASIACFKLVVRFFLRTPDEERPPPVNAQVGKAITKAFSEALIHERATRGILRRNW